jgi:hypothetical protein
MGLTSTPDELRDRSRLPVNGIAFAVREGPRCAARPRRRRPLFGLGVRVKRRTQKIAIRMALGAPSAHVRWLFLRTGVWVVAGGLAPGVPASPRVGSTLQTGVERAESRDPVEGGRGPAGPIMGRYVVPVPPSVVYPLGPRTAGRPTSTGHGLNSLIGLALWPYVVCAGQQLPGRVEGRLAWDRNAGALDELTVVNLRMPAPS